MKKTIITTMGIKLLISFLLLLTCSSCSKQISYNPDQQEQTDYHEIKDGDKTLSYNTNLVNILLMGVDAENFEGQTDLIILATVDRQSKEIDLTVFPRETLVSVPLYLDGEYKGERENYINLAYPFAEYNEKGAKALMEIVSKQMNYIPINDYVLLNYKIFSLLPDLTGEIKITLEDDSLQKYNEEWVEGYQLEINKNTIKPYLKYRDTETDLSPASRRKRQEVYLKQISERITSINEHIAEKIIDATLTNLTVQQLDDLMNSGYKLNKITEIPGTYATNEYHDEFKIDEKALKDLVLDLFYIDENQ